MGRRPDPTVLPSVNGKTLATVLGISPGRVSQLLAAGTIQPNRADLFDLPTAVPAYLASRLAGDGKVKAKDRKAEAEADLAEMERDEKAGRLHKDQDIARVWGGVLMAFRARMLALPTKMAPKVHGMATIADVEAELRTTVNEALKELSEHEPSRFNG